MDVWINRWIVIISYNKPAVKGYGIVNVDFSPSALVLVENVGLLGMYMFSCHAQNLGWSAVLSKFKVKVI